MVAITVILAAVIGAFVLGFGGGGPSAPSVQWESSHNSSGYVIFEHNGGDTIDDPASVLSIQGGGFGANAGSPNSGTLTTGTEFAGDENGAATNNDPSSGEYTLVWSPEDGDSSQQLATHQV